MDSTASEIGTVLLFGNGLNAVTRFDSVAAADRNKIAARPAILVGTDRVHNDHDRKENHHSNCKAD